MNVGLRAGRVLQEHRVFRCWSCNVNAQPDGPGWWRPLVRAFCVLLATGILAGTAASAPRLLHTQSSPLGSLVPGLNAGPAEARFDFALLVLDALIEEHRSEIERARSERPRNPASQEKLLRWQAAASAFLQDLGAAQASLYSARQVELYQDVRGPLQLRIDGASIWLAWPRVEKQWSLEQDLAQTFCRRHPCAMATEPPSSVLPTRVDAGSWSLAQGRLPAWESSDGIRCEFGNLSDRRGKAIRCEALAVELRTLVPVLREVPLPAGGIEWQGIGIAPERDGIWHRLRLNDRGDYIQASLPKLADEAIDWIAVGQWLHARLQGRTARSTVLRLAD
jgi:hypothetical protein